MTTVIAWFHHYWPYIVAVAALLSGAATYVQSKLPKDADGNVTPPPHWGAFIWRAAVDLLSWLPQAGQGGLLGPLNLPGVPSLGARPRSARKPDLDSDTPPSGTPTPEAPPSPPPVPPAAALLLLGFLSASVACTPGGLALGRCELNRLPQTLQSVIASIVAIAASPSSTVGEIENLGIGLLPGQLDCAVQAVAAAVGGKNDGAKAAVDPVRATILKNLGLYLAKHKIAEGACWGVMMAALDESKE